MSFYLIAGAGWLLVSTAALGTVGLVSRQGDEKGGEASRVSAGSSPRRAVGHRWRDYRTASGRRPIKQFLDRLDDEDLASVVAAMREVRRQGLKAARHLDGEIYEVRADGKGVIYSAAGQAQAGVSLAGGSEEEEAEDAPGGDSFGEAKAARLAAARRMIIFSLRY
jgi:hypothetical protein